MKKRVALFFYDLGDLDNRKQNAGFVVRHHYGNNSRIRPDRIPNLTEIEVAIAVYLKPGHVKT